MPAQEEKKKGAKKVLHGLLRTNHRDSWIRPCARLAVTDCCLIVRFSICVSVLHKAHHIHLAPLQAVQETEGMLFLMDRTGYTKAEIISLTTAFKRIAGEEDKIDVQGFRSFYCSVMMCSAQVADGVFRAADQTCAESRQISARAASTGWARVFGSGCILGLPSMKLRRSRVRAAETLARSASPC